MLTFNQEIEMQSTFLLIFHSFALLVKRDTTQIAVWIMAIVYHFSSALIWAERGSKVSSNFHVTKALEASG